MTTRTPSQIADHFTFLLERVTLMQMEQQNTRAQLEQYQKRLRKLNPKKFSAPLPEGTYPTLHSLREGIGLL